MTPRKKDARTPLLAAALVYGLLGPACITESDENVDPGPSDAFKADIEEGDDLTWSGTVNVTDSIRIRGGDLRLAPGARLVMCSGCSITVGWNGNSGSLISAGTDAEPVTIVGAEESEGYWDAIYVNDSADSTTSFSHTEMRHGGAEEGGTLRIDKTISLQNVSFLENKALALAISDAGLKGDSSMISVTSTSGYPVNLEPDAIASFPSDGSFAGNETDMVRVKGGGLVVGGLMRALDVPYLFEGTITMREVELEIEAGAELIFASDAELVVGWNGNTSELKAIGTNDDPITFRGEEDEVGFWGEIRVTGSAKSSTELEHVVIRNGGGLGNGALNIDQEIMLKNVSIEKSKDLGLRVSDVGLKDGSTMVKVTGTVGGYPVEVDSDAITRFPIDGDLSGNEEDAIRVTGGSMTRGGTLKKANVPYFIDTTLTMRDLALEIEPGVELRFASDAGLVVGWNGNDSELRAIGTSEEPIIFTSKEDVDGGEGYSKGYWKGISVGSRAKGTTAFDHVVVRYGGGSNGANLTLDRSISVTNSRIEQSAGAGIKLDYRTPDSPPRDYLSTNSFNGNVGGELVDGRNL